MGWWTAGSIDENEKLNRRESARVLRRTARMIGPYRRNAWRAFALLVSFALLDMAGPLLVRRAIDKGLRAGDTGALNVSVAGYVVVAILAYFTLRWAIASLATVGEGFLRDLRNRVFEKILRQSMSFYDRENAGVLVSRMTSDVDSLQILVQVGLMMFLSSVLILVVSLLTLLVLAPMLLLACLVILPFLAVASVKFHRDSNRAYNTVRDRIGNTLTSLQEGISGVRVVQAFGRENIQIERFADTNEDLYRAHMRSVKVGAWYLPIVEFSGAVTTAVAVGVGGLLVRDGQLSLGTVAAFILILQRLFGPVQQLSQLFNMVQSATAGLNKLYQVLDEPIDVDSAPNASDLPASGRIELKNVSFAYNTGEPVLSGVNLTIADKERVALVGPTGAGKSTVAKLVARFYDPTEGEIRIGDMALKQANVESLRDRIVVVPQEGFLFAGTVADNLRLSRPSATDGEIRAALDRLDVAEIFDRLPEGLETQVQERGSRLSAGEKQLVSLARAALVDPSILILDEATSSVDPGTEAAVERAMDSLMQSRTVIVIAHRLSTSERCDRVGVIDGGRLVELGTHDDLVAAGGHYGELYSAWTHGLSA